MIRNSFLTAAALVILGVPMVAEAVSFNLASQPGPTPAVIRFNGDPTRTITFPNATDGFDFVVQSGALALNGLVGNINGTFTVGTITSPGFGVQVAPVTGSGVFSIFDGVDTLTADVTWSDIFSLGTTLGLNVSGNLNLTNMVYTGTNVELNAMKNDGQGVLTVSAQFVPGMSLTQLMTSNAVNSTSFSGTYNSVPEPASMALIGMGVMALAARRRNRR